jgi:hypothetical protein
MIVNKAVKSPVVLQIYGLVLFWYPFIKSVIQGDQKVSVHLMITIQKVTSNIQVSPASLQGQGDTTLTLTPSIIPNSNYVIIVSDWNCLEYFLCFLYCNHQVHRDFLSPCIIFNVICNYRSLLWSCLFSWGSQEFAFSMQLLNWLYTTTTRSQLTS